MHIYLLNFFSCEIHCGMQIGRLGRVDSDFTAFVHHAGVPSVDIYYGTGKFVRYLKSG